MPFVFLFGSSIPTIPSLIRPLSVLSTLSPVYLSDPTDPVLISKLVLPTGYR